MLNDLKSIAPIFSVGHQRNMSLTNSFSELLPRSANVAREIFTSNPKFLELVVANPKAKGLLADLIETVRDQGPMIPRSSRANTQQFTPQPK